MPINRTHLKAALLALSLLLAGARASAQDLKPAPADPCNAPPDFSQWINCKVDAIAAAKINQKSPNKQVELPSIADNTTSLVDQTEPPDLISTALNLAGLSSKTGETDKTSFSVTTSAYALYAMANKRDPLDPSFYMRHPDLRRFSFTLGRELPDDKDAAANDRATIFGMKVLVINKRDASLPANRARLRAVSDSLRLATPELLKTSFELRQYLYNELAPALGLPATATQASIVQFTDENLGTGRMQATLGMLNEKQMERVNEIIESHIDSAVALKATSMEAFEKIRRKPQLAFNFQSKLRPGDGTDEYRGGLLYDFGLYQRVNLTLNATFDYDDSKKVGGDKRGGRVAGESHFLLTPGGDLFSGRDPVVFSVSGEGKWMSNAKPTYTGQFKLTIPVFDGVELPLSVSFANRRDLINEKTVRGHFGFTFDMAKLLKGFQK